MLVTKLWDMIIRLFRWKGRMHNAKAAESYSGFNMPNTFDFCFLITVKCESNSQISDELY